MLYYSHKARQSAIKNIDKCIAAIYDTTKDELEFSTAMDTIKHLKDMRKVIETEDALPEIDTTEE